MQVLRQVAVWFHGNLLHQKACLAREQDGRKKKPNHVLPGRRVRATRYFYN
jgi:hypothetical protein